MADGGPRPGVSTEILTLQGRGSCGKRRLEKRQGIWGATFSTIRTMGEGERVVSFLLGIKRRREDPK